MEERPNPLRSCNARLVLLTHAPPYLRVNRLHVHTFGMNPRLQQGACSCPHALRLWETREELCRKLV